MRPFSFVFLLVFATCPQVIAQVPHLLNYQGRVSVNQVNFHGTGEFKFALVSEAGDETYWSNDGTSSAGSEPEAAVTRPVVHGLYQVQLGDTGLANMNALPPSVFQRDNVWLRIWFNDGSNGFSQLSPDSRITAVAYAMMAEGVRPAGVTGTMIAPGAVNGSHIGNGTITAANLAPGLLGGGGNPPAGSIAFSADPDSSSMAAAGYTRVSRTTLAQEEWSLASEGEFAFSVLANAEWTGSEMLVWRDGLPSVMRYNPAIDQWTSGNSNGAPVPAIPAHRRRIAWSGNHLYVIGPGSFAKYHPASDAWTPLSTVNAPAAGEVNFVAWTGDQFLAIGDTTGGIYDPVADSWSPISMVGAPGASFFREGARVWTGTELIVWGNASSSTGARYNPATNSWSPMSPSVMAGRIYPHCCWTGSRVLIYGGNANGPGDGGGALYDPATDTWTAINTVGQVWNGGFRSNRSTSSTVWTGTEMIVWGGTDGMGNPLGDGGKYNPATDTWSSIPLAAGVAARDAALAVWTGVEMVLTGGDLASHARYDPVASSWIADRPSSVEPANRSSATSVWTGEEIIIWGGGGSGGRLATGGRFDLLTKMRRPTSMLGAPSPRSGHTAAWSGQEMIIWGGANAATIHADGARYAPESDVWSPMSNVNAPAERKDHTAIWTGNEYIVWGGADGAGVLANGGRYSPSNDLWSPISTLNAPSARRFHGAVWTGEEMLVWGGLDAALTALGDGARYNPATDTWTPMATAGAPSARYVHSMLWAGGEMIVWGGNTPGATNTGARYSPQTDTWSALPLDAAPAARSGQSAVWTGMEMIIWGGANGATVFNSGGRYMPHLNRWEPLSTVSAPSPRTSHGAVWAQGSMLVFGGTGAGFAPLSDIYEYTPPQTIYVYQHP